MRFRYYDPAAGRFVSRDPLGLWGDSAQRGNGQSYCDHNPVNRVDPLGLQASAASLYAHDAALAAVELAIGQAMNAPWLTPDQAIDLLDAYNEIGDARDALGRPAGTLRPTSEVPPYDEGGGFFAGAGDGFTVLVNDVTLGYAWSEDANEARSFYVSAYPTAGTAFVVTSKATSVVIHVVAAEGAVALTARGVAATGLYTPVQGLTQAGVASGRGAVVGGVEGTTLFVDAATAAARPALLQTLRHELVHWVPSALMTLGGNFLRFRAWWGITGILPVRILRVMEEFVAEFMGVARTEPCRKGIQMIWDNMKSGWRGW